MLTIERSSAMESQCRFLGFGQIEANVLGKMLLKLQVLRALIHCSRQQWFRPDEWRAALTERAQICACQSRVGLLGSPSDPVGRFTMT